MPDKPKRPIAPRKRLPKKRPNSRNFRDYFIEHLKAVRKDNEIDGALDRRFSVDPKHFFEPEATTDLPDYFKQSGLDYTAPGHWQYLLVALTNAVHREHAGRKATTPDQNKRFRRGIVRLKLKNPSAKGRELCAMWANEERAKGRSPAHPESLRTSRLQPLLKEARERVANGTASMEEHRFVRALADAKV
jgi:hypothetical protein